MTNTVEFRFKRGDFKYIIKTVNIEDFKSFEELVEKIDMNYVDFTAEIKANWNESISTKG
jgi:hypothetical protein|tara:strand:- start:4817 stop:4996 length:180 start_codon:yes stop_codon:yes gene_type:complete